MPFSLIRPAGLLLWLLIPAVWVTLARSSHPGGSRRRKLLAGFLRSLLVLLAGTILAEPRVMLPSDRVDLFFCLDVSESVGGEARQAAAEFVHKALTGMGAEDRAGLIVFGREPSLEASLQHDFKLPEVRTAVGSNFSNLYAALQLALGRLPPEGTRRILLLSDGNENLQSAVEMAHLAASLGIAVYPVPLDSWFGENEVFLQTVDAPATVPLETPFDIQIVVRCTRASAGSLLLFRNARLLADQPVRLQPGKNVLTFADMLTDPGLFRYKAVVNVPGDPFSRNNEGLAFTRGARQSRILYLTGTAAPASPLAAALQAQGLNVVRRSVEDQADALHSLLAYEAIVLDNVSARSLSFAFMEDVERYVRDAGGGLVMIGGDQGFGAGFYQDTPVERVLPVYMDAPADLKLSGVCLIFVIDKSGSMASQTAGQSKLALAQIAAFASIEMLNPSDLVGLVAFDSDFKWIVPITPAGKRQPIADRLSQLAAGGGTDLFPALTAAREALDREQARRRHVIVLSDGMTDAADFKTLIESMAARDISVSTVAIGRDADVALMADIARWGNGRSYFSDDPQRIPKIFAGETEIIARELITERDLQPRPTVPHAMLQGFAEIAWPPIRGQIVTYPKPEARVLLETDAGPLLAAWRCGLGHSAAFTADLGGRWGKAWTAWDHYGRFAAQMVRWTQKKQTPHAFSANITRQGADGMLTVDVLDAQQCLVNHLALQTRVLYPDGGTRTIPLEQVAPGRYQAIFAAEAIGEYYFSLFGLEPDDLGRPPVFGFGIPYTDEFSRIGIDHALLERLADITGGRVLDVSADAADLFTAPPGPRDRGRPLWPPLTLAFVLLFIADVAVRKIMGLNTEEPGAGPTAAG